MKNISFKIYITGCAVPSPLSTSSDTSFSIYWTFNVHVNMWKNTVNIHQWCKPTFKYRTGLYLILSRSISTVFYKTKTTLCQIHHQTSYCTETLIPNTVKWWKADTKMHQAKHTQHTERRQPSDRTVRAQTTGLICGSLQKRWTLTL